MTNKVTGIQDISLDVIRKKRFRIDGDDNRILELNTSDLNILARLKEAYPRLVNLADNAFKDLPKIEDTTEQTDFINSVETTELIESLKKADSEMRDLMDYIFDSNVSEICAPSGSMYDPISGQFRFEYIINVLAGLYETDIESELTSIAKRVQKHTNKYSKRK
ncbi:hypothetical protein J6O48_08525 [bacterium]|nr:hypothetical protein [bacterium]